MPFNWPKVRLEDVTTILGDGLHGTPEYDDQGNYYFINGNNLSDGRIVFNEKTRRVGKAEYQRHRKDLNDRTILVSINGTLGNIALYRGEKVVLGKSACYFNVRPDVDKHFVRYVIDSPTFQDYIHNLATGSTIKNVSLRLMRDFVFQLPALEQQESISATLLALDDRIDLLRQTNATLEAIAQALFKSWFIDFDPVLAKAEGREPEGMDAATAALFSAEFEDSELGLIPKGWRAASINDIANVIDCLHSKKPETLPEGRPFLQLNAIRDDGLLDWSKVSFISESDYQKWTSRIEVSAGDCVITNVGRVGAVAQVPDGMRAAMGRNMTAIRLRADMPFPTYLIELLQSAWMRTEITLRTDVGTILNALNVRSIPQLRCTLAPVPVMSAFESLSRPIRASMELNLRRAERLAEIRDILLPRLISGKLRLPEAEAKLREAAE